MASEFNRDAKLWVLNEVHKFRTWCNWLKGIDDAHHAQHAKKNALITALNPLRRDLFDEL